MKKLPAGQRWKDDLPVNIKELSELQGVSYSTAVRWAEAPDFPRVGRLLRRSDFEDWWKKNARRRKPAEKPPTPLKPVKPPPLERERLPARAAALLAEAEKMAG